MVLRYPTLLHVFVAFAQCFPDTVDALVVNNIPARNTASVPQYVLDYAPLVHLYSEDAWHPSDIMAQLEHTHPELNYTRIKGGPSPLTLDNLAQLNNKGARDVYLTSDGDFTKYPKWLHGVLPDAKGKTKGAKSCAIIVHDKGAGMVDAFYMYFYAYNEGNKLLNETEELGNHVGDWEHNMVRFSKGKPQAVWYSQHANGAAYVYSAVEKSGKRPIAYSANGTHSNWATAGTHDHTIPDVVLPEGFLVDITDAGPIWDPTLSAYYYSVSYPNNTNGDDSSPTFTALPNPLNNTEITPVNWLNYVGQWGDDQLPESDPRQRGFFFNVTYEYTAGPNGPRFKGLNRVAVCPHSGLEDPPCILRHVLLPGS